MSAAAGTAKPRPSNTAKANKRILEMVVEKEGALLEKLAFLNVLLREELRDLAANEEALRERLKTRGRQIMTQVLGLGSTKQRIPMPSIADIRTLPSEFVPFLPSHLVPEELRPPASGSFTRKRSPNANGLGAPSLPINYTYDDHSLIKEFGFNVTKTAPFIGVQCDPIGFQQHSGECATDSLQQLLLFADQWKAKIQPMVYNMTKKTFTDLFRHYITKGDLLFNAIFLEFFRILQVRFRNHYAMIGTTKYAVNDECVEPFPYRKYIQELTIVNTGLTGALATRKRRMSDNLGVKAKKTLRSLIGISGTTNTEDMVIYFKHIWNFCGLHEYLPLFRARRLAGSNYSQLYPNYNHVAFYLGSDKINPNRPITYMSLNKMLGSAAHATAIYMCDGKWVYYDNNVGVQDIAQPLMDDILNEVDPFYIFWAYEPRTQKILFFKTNFVSEIDKELFIEDMEEDEEEEMAENGRDLSRQTLHMWRNNSWTVVGYDVITALHRETEIYLFKRIIHIVTKERAVPGYPGTHFIDDHGSATIAVLDDTAAGPKTPFNMNAFNKKYGLEPTPAPPALPVPVNSLAGPRKALENALANTRNVGRKRVNNTTRVLEKRIQNLGLNRHKNVNNTTRALTRRILELASGSATRNR